MAYSIDASESSTLIVFAGQAFSHFLQPMQPFEHFALVFAPFSVLLHKTAT
jgi:hypothetical protein